VAEAVAPSAEAPAAVTVEEEEEAEEVEDLEDKDEEEVDETGKKKVKKKGKKGAVEITFDEEKGVYVTRRKRKAGRSKDDLLQDLGGE
jgi:hypothetical protein